MVTIIWGFDETYQWVTSPDRMHKNLHAFMEKAEVEYGPPVTHTKGEAQR